MPAPVGPTKATISPTLASRGHVVECAPTVGVDQTDAAHRYAVPDRWHGRSTEVVLEWQVEQGEHPPHARHIALELDPKSRHAERRPSHPVVVEEDGRVVPRRQFAEDDVVGDEQEDESLDHGGDEAAEIADHNADEGGDPVPGEGLLAVVVEAGLLLAVAA